MFPKNSKHYIVPTAEELGKDTQLVEDVVSFYYSTLRKSLVDMIDMNIQVENLGQFRVKKLSVIKVVEKYEKHLSVLTKDTFSQMQLQKELLAKLEKAKRLSEIVDNERARKKQFYNDKKNGFQKNLEE